MATAEQPDPTEEVQARIRAAGDQLGAAIGDAMRLAFRKAIIGQLAEDFGPGPWLLHPDGRVETMTTPPEDDAVRDP